MRTRMPLLILFLHSDFQKSLDLPLTSPSTLVQGGCKGMRLPPITDATDSKKQENTSRDYKRVSCFKQRQP